MKLNGKKKIVPYLFILPWMIGFVVFTQIGRAHV